MSEIDDNTTQDDVEYALCDCVHQFDPFIWFPWCVVDCLDWAVSQDVVNNWYDFMDRSETTSLADPTNWIKADSEKYLEEQCSELLLNVYYSTPESGILDYVMDESVACAQDIAADMQRSLPDESCRESFWSDFFYYLFRFFVFTYLEQKHNINPYKNIHEYGKSMDLWPEASGCYLARARGTRLFKIGISVDIRKRLQGLSTSCPHPIDLALVCRTTNKEEVEKRLHKQLKNKRTNGEWFCLNSDDYNEVERVFKREDNYVQTA